MRVDPLSASTRDSNLERQFGLFSVGLPVQSISPPGLSLPSSYVVSIFLLIRDSIPDWLKVCLLAMGECTTQNHLRSQESTPVASTVALQGDIICLQSEPLYHTLWGPFSSVSMKIAASMSVSSDGFRSSFDVDIYSTFCLRSQLPIIWLHDFSS